MKRRAIKTSLTCLILSGIVYAQSETWNILPEVIFQSIGLKATPITNLSGPVLPLSVDKTKTTVDFPQTVYKYTMNKQKYVLNIPRTTLSGTDGNWSRWVDTTTSIDGISTPVHILLWLQYHYLIKPNGQTIPDGYTFNISDAHPSVRDSDFFRLKVSPTPTPTPYTAN